jgi:pimeloyl-ACP methyl ester carboxylesterase
VTTFQTGDDARISFSDWGDADAEPIVLVHAWALNGDMWNYQVPPFVDAGFRVITFDRRGHGRSDRSGHGYDYDTLAGDLGALNPDGIDPTAVAAVRQLMMRDMGLWLDATSAGYWGAASVESEVSSGVADWTRRAAS